MCRRSNLLTAEEGGERGAKSYDGEKALVLYKSFHSPWVSYIGHGDKREQRKGLNAELRQDYKDAERDSSETCG